MLEIGTQAPEFTLPDQNGELKSLSDFRGQKVILYFYPKDMTAGCAKQACAFGELYPQFREKGAAVIGISKDSVASHKRFEEKYGLPFTLLSRRSARSRRRIILRKCSGSLNKKEDYYDLYTFNKESSGDIL